MSLFVGFFSVLSFDTDIVPITLMPIEISWRRNMQAAFETSQQPQSDLDTEDPVADDSQNTTLSLRSFDESVHTGFQIVTKSGPLCGEPMMGVVYFVEDFTLNVDENNADGTFQKCLKMQNGARFLTRRTVRAHD